MIQLGLLWFDDDPRRPLAQKVDLAVRRYRERLGRTPDVCQLHPTQAAALAAQKVTNLPPLRLVPDVTLHPNYFLVGTEDEAASVEPGWAAALAENQETVASKSAAQVTPPTAGRRRTRAGASRVVAARAQTDQTVRTFVTTTLVTKTSPTTSGHATTAATPHNAASAVSAPISVRTRSRLRKGAPVAASKQGEPPRRTRLRTTSQAPAAVPARGRQLAIVQAPLPLDAVPVVPVVARPAARRKRRTDPPAVPPTARNRQRTHQRATAPDSAASNTGDQRDHRVTPRRRTREWGSRLASQKPATPAEPGASEAHPRRHRHAS